MGRVRHHGLKLVFLGLLVVALVGQAIAGHADFDEEERAHATPVGDEPARFRWGAT